MDNYHKAFKHWQSKGLFDVFRKGYRDMLANTVDHSLSLNSNTCEKARAYAHGVIVGGEMTVKEQR